jgi:hypothetical protein
VTLGNSGKVTPKQYNIRIVGARNRWRFHRN